MFYTKLVYIQKEDSLTHSHCDSIGTKELEEVKEKEILKSNQSIGPLMQLSTHSRVAYIYSVRTPPLAKEQEPYKAPRNNDQVGINQGVFHAPARELVCVSTESRSSSSSAVGTQSWEINSYFFSH